MTAAPTTDAIPHGLGNRPRRRVARHRRFIGLILVGVIAAVAAAVLGGGFGLNPSYVPSALLDRPAPVLTGPTLTGGRFTLAQDRGHPVLVDFWASWCTACRLEQPLLNRVAMELQPRGLRMVGVDMSDTRPDAKAFLAGFGGARYPSVLDPNAEIAATWGVFGIPETYLISTSGHVLAKETGIITAQWLWAEVLPRLAAR